MGKWTPFAAALLMAVLALSWPYIEDQLRASGMGCPWPFSQLKYLSAPVEQPIQAETSDLAKFTAEDLLKYDGSDEDLPILLSIGGKVVDVTSGKRFYGKKGPYKQFAGQVCTRALALGSLSAEDVSDDTSDFTPEQKKELDEIKAFYYDKYPVVGQLI